MIWTSHRALRLTAFVCALGLATALGAPVRAATKAASPTAASKRPAKPVPRVPSFTDEPAKLVHTFLAGLERDFDRAFRGDKAAQKKIRKRALVSRFIAPEIKKAVATLHGAGRVVSVKLTGFELRATLWWGIVPLEDVGIFFWKDAHGFRLMRLAALKTDPRIFGRPPSPGWLGKQSRAFGALATEAITKATAGKCDALPIAGPKDFAAFLPPDPKAAKATRNALNTDRASIMDACKALTGVPVNQISWRLGQLGGVATVRTGKKHPATKKFSFHAHLVAGANGTVRLYGLSEPIAPKK